MLYREMVMSKKIWTILSLCGFSFVLFVGREESFFYQFGWILFIFSFWVLWWQHYVKVNKHILENIHLALMGILLLLGTLGVIFQVLEYINYLID